MKLKIIIDTKSGEICGKHKWGFTLYGCGKKSTREDLVRGVDHVLREAWARANGEVLATAGHYLTSTERAFPDKLGKFT